MIAWETLRQRLLPSQVQRNFRLGVANGILFSLAEALVDANLVLALFVRELGGSQALVGLLPSLKNGGFLLPQLLVAGRIEGMPRKMPLYRRRAIARTIAFGLMTLVIFGALYFPASITLFLLFSTYAVYNLAGGASSLAFQDIVAKAIPPRRRGSFFSYRQLYGGLLAFFIAGPLVRATLQGNSVFAFPNNYGILCLLALIFLALGLLTFSFLDEPALARPSTPHSLKETLQAAPRLIRENVDFRRFIIARILGRVGAIGEPFYIVYAREALNIAPRYVGIYLALRVLTAALSNLYWGRVADNQGNRRLMVLTGAIAALVPLTVLLVPQLFALGSATLGWAFSFVFLLIGLSIDGSATAGTTYLLEIAPETERATYFGIANTALGLVTFLPVLGGLLLTTLNNNYAWLFAIGMIFSLLACVATIRLREVRHVREDMRQAALMQGQQQQQ